MNFTESWTATARSVAERAASETCECGSQKTVGYSKLGIPVVACPKCQPSLVANGRKPVGEAWGFSERS